MQRSNHRCGGAKIPRGRLELTGETWRIFKAIDYAKRVQGLANPCDRLYTPGSARIYGLMWAVTEVAPLSPPMVSITCTAFVVPVKFAPFAPAQSLALDGDHAFCNFRNAPHEGHKVGAKGFGVEAEQTAERIVARQATGKAEEFA